MTERMSTKGGFSLSLTKNLGKERGFHAPSKGGHPDLGRTSFQKARAATEKVCFWDPNR